MDVIGNHSSVQEIRNTARKSPTRTPLQLEPRALINQNRINRMHMAVVTPPPPPPPPPLNPTPKHESKSMPQRKDSRAPSPPNSPSSNRASPLPFHWSRSSHNRPRPFLINLPAPAQPGATTPKTSDCNSPFDHEAMGWWYGART